MARSTRLRVWAIIHTTPDGQESVFDTIRNKLALPKWCKFIKEQNTRHHRECYRLVECVEVRRKTA